MSDPLRAPSSIPQQEAGVPRRPRPRAPAPARTRSGADPPEGSLSRRAQWGPHRAGGGTPRGSRQVSRETSSPAAPRIASHPAPQLAARGAQSGGADREGAARVTSAVPRSGKSPGPPPPAPARVSLSPGRGERQAVPGRPSWRAPRPPARRPPRRGALPRLRAPGHTGEGARRGAAKPEGSSGPRGERGGRGAGAGSARPARRPLPGRAAINGARGGGGGGGIWRQLEARTGAATARRLGVGGAAGGRLGVKFRGARGGDACGPRGCAPSARARTRPRGGAASVDFRSSFSCRARGRCQGGCGGRCAPLCPRPPGERGRARRGRGGGGPARSRRPFVQVMRAAAWSSRATAGGCWAA